MCLLEVSRGRRWHTSAQQVCRWVQRGAAAASHPLADTPAATQQAAAGPAPASTNQKEGAWVAAQAARQLTSKSHQPRHTLEGQHGVGLTLRCVDACRSMAPAGSRLPSWQRRPVGQTCPKTARPAPGCQARGQHVSGGGDAPGMQFLLAAAVGRYASQGVTGSWAGRQAGAESCEQGQRQSGWRRRPRLSC